LGDVVEKFLELIPFIRDGSQLLRIAFSTWVIFTAVLAVIAIIEAVSRPSPPTIFSVDLKDGSYYEERELLLTGSGLAAGATLTPRVYLVEPAGRVEEPQPDANVVRSSDSSWQLRWIKFSNPGKHDILIDVKNGDGSVTSPKPIRVIVGAWAAMAPPSATSGKAATPTIASAGSIGQIRIRDTGPEGSIAGLAVASAIEASYAAKGEPLPYLSGRYLYERSQRLDSMEPDAIGTSLSRVINVADRFGVFDEAVWPYVPEQRSLPNGMTWDKLDSIAIDKGRRATFRKLDSLEQAKSEIGLGLPVLVGFRVTENFMKYKGGIYETPASQGAQDQFIGLTAIVLVAYDPDADAFRFANMWGTGWGEKGFGRISSSAMQAGVDSANIWSVAPTN
jgi:hypothetical protein